MKIAILNIYNGIVDRGSEVFVDELASFLSRRHKVCVYQTGKESKKYKIYNITGIPFINFQGSSLAQIIILQFFLTQLYSLNVLFFTLACFLHLLKEKYDWIIPINGGWQSILCRLLRILSGCKILISGHSGVGFDDRLNINIGKPDIFIALTQKAYRWARSISSGVQIEYIPNGIRCNDPQVKKVSNKSQYKLPRPIVLCVGALLPYKKIDQVIYAISKIEKVNVMIIGSGPLKNKIYNLGKNLLGKRFLYKEQVPHGEMQYYYANADLFSMPSAESEAFGIVYLEAMSANLPIVAPDYESRKEIISDAGLYYEPNNIDDYAKKLEKALHTNFYDKPKQQALKFSWSLIGSMYEKVME